MKEKVVRKNPAWTEEEMVLALDVYFKLDNDEFHKRSRRILDLSVMLNHLDIHGRAMLSPNFRNPAGVTMILQNIASYDPERPQKGLANGSKMAKKMFEQYQNNQEKLHRLAWDVKDSIRDPMIRYGLHRYGDDYGGELSNFVHQEYERLSNMLQVKKEIADSRNEVVCEVCALDFNRKYGKHSGAAMSCHHDESILRLDAVDQTAIEDWSIVCQNCHSVMHQHPIVLTTHELKTWMDTLH